MKKIEKLKKVFAGVAVLAMVFFLLPKTTVADVDPTTVNYLKNLPPTAWVTMALIAAGETTVATDYLKSVSGVTVNDYAKAILALAAANLNPRTYGNVDYVSQIKSMYQGNQLGDPTLLSDDCWGILALSAAGEDKGSAQIVGAKNFILSNQNSDGGFSYAPGVSSDTNSTAVVILALIEAGQDKTSAVITKALNYLLSGQNSDGGFSWTIGDESDVNSTAWAVWAIKKIGQDPESLVKDGHNPIDFIESLKNADGSFGRMKSSLAANLFATHDAAIALAGATIPVGYFQPVQAGTYHFRIEGQNANLCDADIAGVTAFDLLKNGAEVCNYTYSGTTYEGLGYMLSQINLETATGFGSWMYLVNNLSPAVGISGYQMQPGDEVLIYYDPDYRTPAYPDYDRPLRLTVNSDNLSSGQDAILTIEYFNSNGNWTPAASSVIKGFSQDYTANEAGQVEVDAADGVYTVYAQKNDYIRSNLKIIRVGDGVAQTVNLQVEIGNGGSGTIGGESIIFEVTPHQLNFGNLQPGGSAQGELKLANQGTVNLKIFSAVTGDAVFANNLTVANVAWRKFNTELGSDTEKNAAVGLKIPSSYIGSGIKTGELIFWAQPQ